MEGVRLPGRAAETQEYGCAVGDRRFGFQGFIVIFFSGHGNDGNSESEFMGEMGEVFNFEIRA